MFSKIAELSEKMQPELSAVRRDLHSHPETAWLEMRTSAIIARKLKELSCYEVLVGRDVCDDKARMDVPAAEVLDAHYRAVEHDCGYEEFLPYTKGGFTGVVGILRCGAGPTVALRFDIDALGVIESEDESHVPAREGFASRSFGMMHACGHDGHTATGLGVAGILAEIKDSLRGTVKLIFQPGEEGVRGAGSIVSAGHLDGVDYVIGNHIAPMPDGDKPPFFIVGGDAGDMATVKLDVSFSGSSAHASGAPHEGRNALQAAACAVMNLYAIPRHGDGASRINVGTLNAGTGRNVIADTAEMQMEIRGKKNEILAYMENCARKVIAGAAQMYSCSYDIKVVGYAPTSSSSPKLRDRILEMMEREMPEYRAEKAVPVAGGASEDFTVMMEKVKESGGEALFFNSLCPMQAPLHNRMYDMDEAVIGRAVRVFASAVYEILK